ncbi:MAG: hypothetical protein MRZ79_02330 [Bacteroidia bacterium]|nr:hypothetical protein [Bacteroidia bacterium]
MVKRKIWRLWNILSLNERNHFIRFLRSELEGKHGYLQNLAETLPRESDSELTDMEVWTALYPDIPYDDGRLRKLCGDLTSWLEDYLAIQGFRKNNGLKSLVLLRELADRQAGEEFVKAFNKAEKRWERDFSIVNLTDQYYRKFQLEIEKQNFVAKNRLNPAILKGFSKQAYIQENENLLEVTKAFTDYWTIQSFILGVDRSISTYKQTDPRIIFFKEGLNLLQERSFSGESFQIQLFQQILFPAERSLEAFETNFSLLRDNSDKFSMEDLQIATSIIVNFLSIQLRKTGDKKVVSLLLEILIWGISEGPLLNNGILRAFNYNNFINLCLRARKFDMAKRYLEELKPLLSINEREEAYAMAMAGYLTAMDKPGELIRFLIGRSFSNPRYDVDARIRIIQANYEIDPMDDIWLLAQISNIQKLIRNRKGLLPLIKKQRLTFLRYFKLLVQSNSVSKKEKVRLQILETQPFPNKTWLLDKLT